MAKKGTDFSAALTGLVLGAAVMFLLVFTVMMLTNKKFEGHSAPTHPAPGTATPVTPTSPSGPPAGTPATTPPAAGH